MKYKIAKPLAIYELGKRSNQEDAIYPKFQEATTNDTLFIVCDGMGGHDNGELASSLVTQTIAKYIAKNCPDDNFSQTNFENALSAAFDSLDKADNNATNKMGTTLTFLKLNSDGAFLAHIGDSRIYHIRPSQKQILYKSRDHSLINDLYDAGEITKEEMKTSKQKNIITRALQPNLENRPSADIKIVKDVEPGDFFYLCTDGMLEQSDDQNILNILSLRNSNQDKINILQKVTSNNSDNHSAYLIQILPNDSKVTDSTSKNNIKIIISILAIIVSLLYLCWQMFW